MPGYIDTHTHLYLKEFDADRQETVRAAVAAGVKYMLLPNVDERTLNPMLDLCSQFPAHCLPMMGLHPTSVKPGYQEVLARMKPWFEKQTMVAVGETGIDLYWDKTHYQLQVESFTTQIEWALEYDLPLVIHSRNSVEEIMAVLAKYRGTGLKGVMHCFPGDVQQAEWFIQMGFLLGIGGVVTYKNSMMAKVAQAVNLEYLILETDAPYLPPVPYRGKRNEPAYIPYIAEKIAEIKQVPVNRVAEITTANAARLFNISP